MDHTVKIIKSERGKDLALVNSCKYRFIYQRRDGAIKWRCTKNKCSANIVTDCDRTTVIVGAGEHNHELDPLVKIERQCLREICKQKRNDGFSFRPSKIIDAELSKTDFKLQKKDLMAIKKALYLKRQKDWDKHIMTVRSKRAPTASPAVSAPPAPFKSDMARRSVWIVSLEFVFYFQDDSRTNPNLLTQCKNAFIADKLLPIEFCIQTESS